MFNARTGLFKQDYGQSTLVDGFYPDDPDIIEATPIDRVIPERIRTCPECGGWFGPEDSSWNTCGACGHEPSETTD